jgi:hypothetical protein
MVGFNHNFIAMGGEMVEKRPDKPEAGGAELRARLSKIGEAKRGVLGIEPTNASQAIKRRITAIAAKHGMMVEWTLRPISSIDAEVGCGCGCGCGCSCIA